MTDEKDQLIQEIRTWIGFDEKIKQFTKTNPTIKTRKKTKLQIL